MELNSIIFSILIFCLGFFVSKYFLLILNRSKINLLNDNQFNKPQAFHESPISIGGGITIFLSSVIVALNFWFFKKRFIIYLWDMVMILWSQEK